MCKVVYIAADGELPVIAPGEPPPPLSVRALTAQEEVVRGVLTQPFVYFVGSHTGCSCGFDYAAGEELEREGRDSVRHLREYLESATGLVGTVALFACWNGDEAEGAVEHVEVTPDYFGADMETFEVPERWHAIVRARAS